MAPELLFWPPQATKVLFRTDREGWYAATLGIWPKLHFAPGDWILATNIEQSSRSLLQLSGNKEHTINIHTLKKSARMSRNPVLIPCATCYRVKLGINTCLLYMRAEFKSAEVEDLWERHFRLTVVADRIVFLSIIRLRLQLTWPNSLFGKVHFLK